MKNENITGIGCFAKPATLNRVFQKMIRSYALGTLEAIRAETTCRTFGQGNVGLLDALMADRLQTQPVQAAHGLENKKVICELCPHFCKLDDGQIGNCNVRKNSSGKLYSLVYGKAIAVHVDPI